MEILGGTLLTSLISSGFLGLVVGLFVYLVMPKVIEKLNTNNVSPETLEKISDGLGKLRQIKESVDTDPTKEDLVEKILKYSHVAVMASEQLMKAKEDNAKKKEYAVDLASKMLLEYKKNNSEGSTELNDVEKDIIKCLIEATVYFEKKQGTMKEQNV